jgi:N-acetylneuraminic acid mutarotase
MVGMKKLKLIALLLVVFVTLYPAIVQSASATFENSWIERTPMNEARGRLGVVTANGKIYAIGGDAGRLGGLIGSQYKNAGTSLVLNVTEEYDPATNTWSFKASMPTPRDYFGVAICNGKIYCIGGMTPTAITAVNEVYDPASDTWETKTPMPAIGYWLNTLTVDGKIYVIKAFNNDAIQVYDPATDSWTEKAPMPHQILGSASVVLDNKIYLIDKSGYIQIYDPTTDGWKTGAQSPITEDSAVGCATSGSNAPKRIYFFDETGTYIYDPVSDKWSNGTSLPTPRGYAGVAVVDDLFYVVGGETFPPEGVGTMSPTAANEQYTPFGYRAVSSSSPSLTPSPSVPEMSLLVAVAVVTVVSVVVVVVIGKRGFSRV